MSALEDALRLVREAELPTRCEGVAQLAGVPGDEATEALVGLLEETSWYLRERVVEALERRGEAGAARRVLREGAWFARASACDLLGRCGGVDVLDDLLLQVEDRNVSLQKSAVLALRRVCGRAGNAELARRIAGLSGDSRRRVMARVGHQEPAWARDLERDLEALPSSVFAPAGERGAADVLDTPGQEERALKRFRRWLSGAGTGARA